MIWNLVKSNWFLLSMPRKLSLVSTLRYFGAELFEEAFHDHTKNEENNDESFIDDPCESTKNCSVLKQWEIFCHSFLLVPNFDRVCTTTAWSLKPGGVPNSRLHPFPSRFLYLCFVHSPEALFATSVAAQLTNASQIQRKSFCGGFRAYDWWVVPARAGVRELCGTLAGTS